MNKQQLDWQKTAKWFAGFAIGKLLFDLFFKGNIDFYGVIGIPIIALVLIYLIDKKQLCS